MHAFRYSPLFCGALNYVVSIPPILSPHPQCELKIDSTSNGTYKKQNVQALTIFNEWDLRRFSPQPLLGNFVLCDRSRKPECAFGFLKCSLSFVFPYLPGNLSIIILKQNVASHIYIIWEGANEVIIGKCKFVWHQMLSSASKKRLGYL